MVKKIVGGIGVLVLCVNLCGCVALLAGAAGAGGTAVWLSGKLSEDVNAPLSRSVQAVESALRSLDLDVTKKTVEKEVAQVMSKNPDGKTIWIDVRRISDSSSKIEIRVGGVQSDKAAADEILQQIKRHL